MSRAFVQGKDRPSMPKPDIPDGFRKVKYHGKVDGGRKWKLPWPLESRHSANGKEFAVNKDGMGLMDDETWEWTRTNCPDAFTEVDVKLAQVDEVPNG